MTIEEGREVPPNNKPSPNLFSTRSEESVWRESELITLRQMSSSLEAMTKELVSHREVMTSIREDMAVMKERQNQHAETKKEMKKLDDRVASVETRISEQRGAMGLATALRDFGPWLFGIVAGLWGVFQTFN